MSARWSWAVVLGGVLAYIATVAATAVAPASAMVPQWIRFLSCVIAGVLVVVGAVVHRPSRMGPWLLLAVSSVLFAGLRPLTDLVGMDFVAAATDGTLIAISVVQMSSYAAAALVFLLIRRPVHGPTAWMDVAVLVAGMTAAIMLFMIPYHVRPLPVDPATRTSLLVVLWLLAVMLVVVTTVAAVLLFIDDLRGLSARLLVTGFLFSAGAVTAAQTAGISDVILQAVMDVSPIFVPLFAAAALHPSMVELTLRSTGSRPDWSRGRTLLLGIAGCLPIVTAIFGARSGTLEQVALLGLQGLVVGLVIVRARSAVGRLAAEERRSRTLSLTDALTGLLNRRGAWQVAGERSQERYGMAFVDLDGFKRINEVHGYTVGDQVLQEVGRRLSVVAGSSGTVSRLGGDEFALLFHSADPAREGTELAEAVRRAMAVPVQVDDKLIKVSAGIGLADDLPVQSGSVPDENDDPFLGVLRRADLALHGAKSAGGNHAVHYSAELERKAMREAELAEVLGWAVSGNLVRLVYQGCYRLADGAVIGAEALLRLSVPKLGEVSPGEFIPLAERNGRILELGDWVLSTATDALDGADGALPPDFRLSVNVSAIQLHAPPFVDSLVDLVGRRPELMSLLRLEITESCLAGEAERAAIVRLAEIGCQIALDDFGADYASLQYLTRMPVEVLKLDRSFVKRMTVDPADRAVVRHVMALADDLGIAVIAEGVEQVEQVEILQGLGCRFGQGFLWDRPAPGLDRFLRVPGRSGN